jgi:hypothetical protein
MRFWRYFRQAVCLTVLLSLSACKDPARSGYLELTGHIFIFNPRIASATYMVTLAVTKPVPDGSQVVATFEDPAGSEAIVVQQKLKPAQQTISLESPDLQCIKKDRRYAFTVSLRDQSDKELQLISSGITSTLDQDIMPDAPLVVGPAYDKNPALKGRVDGKIPGLVKPACPA